MLNRNPYRKHAVELFELAATEFENKNYDAAVKHEDNALIDLKHAHSEEHAHVDHYIQALHFCRTAFILYVNGRHADAHTRFTIGFDAFKELSSKDLTHEMYVYFAQAHYAEALMYATIEKEYRKANRCAKKAIHVIKDIPKKQHTAEDDVCKLSYEMLITMDNVAMHPEESEDLWEKFMEKMEDVFGRYFTHAKIKNNVNYLEAANKGGELMREIPGLYLQDRDALLKMHSVFKPIAPPPAPEGAPEPEPSLKFNYESIRKVG